MWALNAETNWVEKTGTCAGGSQHNINRDFILNAANPPPWRNPFEGQPSRFSMRLTIVKFLQRVPVEARPAGNHPRKDLLPKLSIPNHYRINARYEVSDTATPQADAWAFGRLEKEGILLSKAS